MTVGTALVQILSEIGVDVTSPTITSSDFQMRQLKSLMEEAGRDIGWRAEWAKAMSSFTPVSTSDYDLPSDFQKVKSVTLNDDEYTPVRGITDPAMWELASRTDSDQVFYHLRDGKIYFSVAVNSNGATVRYVSKNWLVGQDSITSNDNVPVFPDYLLVRSTVVRWRRAKGMPFDDLLQEFEAALEVAIKADRV